MDIVVLMWSSISCSNLFLNKEMAVSTGTDVLNIIRSVTFPCLKSDVPDLFDKVCVCYVVGRWTYHWS